jgi:hypothetical protein
MPSFDTFDAYATRIEKEMSPGKRKDPGRPTSKTCSVCQGENKLGARECEHCGHEFPVQEGKKKTCPSCNTLNSLASKSCSACGHSFMTPFSISLSEAMREGAIIRGLHVDEVDVREAERIAPELRRRALASNDEAIVRVFRLIPDKCADYFWLCVARLRSLCRFLCRLFYGGSVPLPEFSVFKPTS